MRTSTVVLLAILGLFGAAQLARPARTNPPVDAPLGFGDPAAEAIARRACFDCHSNETRWPWYSAVSPVSWLVVHDVNEGRGKMNFSSWRDPKRELRHEICEEVKEGEMPLRIYRPLHPDARLTPADVQTLCAWAERAAERAALVDNAPSAPHP